jgi:hypothetical protein
MISSATPRTLVAKRRLLADRIGVFASVLCALPCAPTPVRLLQQVSASGSDEARGALPWPFAEQERTFAPLSVYRDGPNLTPAV